MLTQTNLKIAIVGCGNMAKVHGRFLTKILPKHNLALCDRDPLRLESFAKSLAIGNTFEDLSLMLENFKPDIVHIVTPPSTHTPIALTCLQKGSHVLIEKPICITSQDAKIIQKQANNSGRLVCVNHMRSYDPMIVQTKSLLDSGAYGKLENIFIGYSYDYLERLDSDPAARWINKLPGGSFFDLMPHLLCLLDDFLPNLKLLTSYCEYKQEQVLTDLHCLFSSDVATAHMHMSLGVKPLKNFIEFECTNGNIRVDLRNFIILKRKTHGLPNAIERIVQNIGLGFQYIFGSLSTIYNFARGKLDPYAGLERIIEQFNDAVLSGKEPPVSIESSIRLLELTESIFSDDIKKRKKFVTAENTLNNCDVLVTGGTGFIGKRLVNKLLSQNKKVRIFSHRNISQDQLENMYSGTVDFYRGNIYSQRDISQACQGISQVYHLAAAMGGDWNYHLDTTITGTNNLLRAIKENSVKQLIYVSTLNVYDAKHYPNNIEINELFPYDDRPEKRGSYSHAKLIAEKEVVKFSENNSDIAIRIYRPGLVYGPSGKIFFNDVAYRIKNIALVFGMGNRKLPLIYLDNLIDGLTALSNKQGGNLNIINLVDRDYPSQKEYMRLYKKLTSENFITIYIPLFLIKTGFWWIEKLVKILLKKDVSLIYKLECIEYSPIHSTKKAEETLSWRQTTYFDEGLRNTIKASEYKT